MPAHGPSGSTRFLGRGSDGPNLLATYNLFVLPFLTEAKPLASPKSPSLCSGNSDRGDRLNAKIPKRLIQTSKTRNLPLLEQGATQSLRLNNPDFAYIFFDDAQVEEFIDREFPEYRAVFDSFPIRIQRYDFFRYLAVYRLGGFYFDTDVIFAKGLDDLIKYSCVFPFEELTIYSFLRERHGMDWEIGNYGFGASAGHPFLGQIIRNCVRALEQPHWADEMMESVPQIFRSDLFVLSTTGPGLVSRTLAEYSGDFGDIKVLFPEDVCDASNWHCFGNYGIHLQIGGWRKSRGFIHGRLNRWWETRRRRALLKVSAKLGAKRSLDNLARRADPTEALRA